MGPIRDRIGNKQWLARILCASALLAHGAVAAPADPLVSPQEQAIAQSFEKLAAPKTGAFKPPRGDWQPYKKQQGREVYRHRGEVLVRMAAPGATAAVLSGDAEIKRHTKRSAAVTADTQRVEFDEQAIGLDAFIAKLRAQPGVAAVEPNLIHHVQEARNYQNKLWHLEHVQEHKTRWKQSHGLATSGAARPAHQTTVCTLDTGVDLNHEDLKDNLIPGVNVISHPLLGEPNDSEMDYNGHGTMVAGIIAALDNDLGVEGVNPHAALCAIKAFDQEGTGTLSDVLAGVEWAIAHKIDVLNLSFGNYEYSALLETQLQRARASGMLVIAAAGNDYADDVMYPANYTGVLAVGSHDEAGWISRFSNWGRRVDFFAPGNAVLTTNLSEHGEDRYTPFFGTSAAAAYVSGLASLLRDAGYSSTQVEDALKANVYLAANNQNPTDATYRVLNAQALLADADHTSIDAVAVSKFLVAQRVVGRAGVFEIDVAVQNVGTRVSKDITLNLKVANSSGDRLVALDHIAKIARAQSYTKHYSVPVAQLDPQLHLARGEVADYALALQLDGASAPPDQNLQRVLVTDQPISALKVRALWVTPLDFTDQNTHRVLSAVVENTGNLPLDGLVLRAAAIPALHEGVPRSPRTPIGAPQNLPVLTPGQTATIVMAIDDFVPPPNVVTFALEFVRGNEVEHVHLQGYRYADHRGQFTPQYAQVVHRNIVDQAIRLLEKQGIVIPDLQNALYRGNPAQANGWPQACVLDKCLPDNTFSTSGYWTDQVLNNAAAFFNVAGFSLIDGSHDADAIDIAFGYHFEDTFDSHFWIVDNYDDDGLNSNGSNHHSALTKLRALLFGGNGSQLPYGAIAHYKAGYKKAAWWFLGHAAHLMGDISVPSHVDNENSHGVYGATYHDWMDKGNYAKWSYLDAAQNGGFVNAYAEKNEGDPLRFLAYTTAQVGNSFPWASTMTATQYGSAGNRTAGGNVPHYDNYMAGLYAKMAPRPLARWQVNKDEVWDHFWGECQLVDWVGPNESRSDCQDHDGVEDRDNSDNDGNDSDGDMTRIAQTNYPYAIRATAGLIYWFAVETGQIARVEVRNALPAIVGLILN